MNVYVVTRVYLIKNEIATQGVVAVTDSLELARKRAEEVMLEAFNRFVKIVVTRPDEKKKLTEEYRQNIRIKYYILHSADGNEEINACISKFPVEVARVKEVV